MNKDLLYSLLYSAPRICGNLDWGGVLGRMDTCVCIYMCVYIHMAESI